MNLIECNSSKVIQIIPKSKIYFMLGTVLGTVAILAKLDHGISLRWGQREENQLKRDSSYTQTTI